MRASTRLTRRTSTPEPARRKCSGGLCTGYAASRWRSSQGLLADRAGQQRPRAVRKHITESAHASLRRLQTDYLDLYQAHRYDYGTPLAETMRAFDDLVRQGKVLYVGVSEWRADQIAEALKIADEMGFDRLISNQPQYNMIWRVIESEVIPLCEQEGIGQRLSPDRQGVLTGKYRPGSQPPAGSRATDPSGSGFIQRSLTDGLLTRCRNCGAGGQAGLSLAAARGRPGCCRTRTCPRRSSALPGRSRSGRT